MKIIIADLTTYLERDTTNGQMVLIRLSTNKSHKITLRPNQATLENLFKMTQITDDSFIALAEVQHNIKALT